MSQILGADSGSKVSLRSMPLGIRRPGPWRQPNHFPAWSHNLSEPLYPHLQNKILRPFPEGCSLEELFNSEAMFRPSVYSPRGWGTGRWSLNSRLALQGRTWSIR